MVAVEKSIVVTRRRPLLSKNELGVIVANRGGRRLGEFNDSHCVDVLSYIPFRNSAAPSPPGSYRKHRSFRQAF